jgi:hypothetical protein
MDLDAHAVDVLRAEAPGQGGGGSPRDDAMYIERLELSNVKTFVHTAVEFVHPDRAFRPRRRAGDADPGTLPKPLLPNVNLLLGENGSGKTTILRAIAMAALGPAFGDTRLPTTGMLRRGGAGPRDSAATPGKGSFRGDLLLHHQDRAPGRRVRAGFELGLRGELENAAYVDAEPALWDPVFESRNDAFFAVGYGATRRVEAPENLDMAARGKSTFLRGQRLQGLFQDSFSLIPLSSWLPVLKVENPGRYKQVQNLLNRLLKPGRYAFTGERDRGGDYLFEHGPLKVPFQALSDGYRAFIGWVADMLFHVCYGCPSGKKLVENSGIILVDEIDLHLHPRWQMTVIPTVARALPRMQFVLTSHSPLVAGSLEWMNITTLKVAPRSNATTARRLRQSIHGLDADQVLISDFFGLRSSRTPRKARRLDELTRQARGGNGEAAMRVVAELARGLEEAE